MEMSNTYTGLDKWVSYKIWKVECGDICKAYKELVSQQRFQDASEMRPLMYIPLN